MQQADAAGLERRIAEKVGDGSAESQSVVPVLRPESKTATLWDMAMIWAGAQLIVGTWAVGALATVVFGLNLTGAITAIIVGNVLGGLMVGATALMGKHGAPQMLLMRYGLGMKGSNMTSFFNFVSSIGWFSFNTVLTTLATFQVFELLGVEAGVAAKALVLVAILVLQILFGLTNFHLMKKVEAVLVLPTVLFVLVMTYFALQGVNWGAPATGPAEGGGFSYWSMWISTVGAVGIAYWGAWAPYGADFSRFYRFDRPGAGKKLFWLTFGVGTVIGIWLEVIGAVFATRFGGADPAIHIVGAIPAFALPALVIVLGGLFSTNVLNLVNGGLSAKAIWKTGSRAQWTIFIAIVGSLMSAYSVFVTDVASAYHTFLVALLIWEAPWFAILVVDYFLVRKQDYQIEDLYGLNNAIPGFNKPGLISYAAGFVAAALTSFTGVNEVLGIPLYSPIMLNYFNGMDVSFFVGAAVAGSLYYVLQGQKSGADAPARKTTPIGDRS